MTRFEDIEIHPGDLDRPYRVIRKIKVTVRGGSLLVKNAGPIDANAKLRESAGKVGANAVLGVEYRRITTLTSWQSIQAVGLAVVVDAARCSSCAEMVNPAASRCKHCGAELTPTHPVADWYSDPKGEQRLRYWDGKAWTDHTAI
jgi:hypothetical protein